MEKEKESLTLDTGPVKLYLDEIVEIAEAFLQIGNDGKLKIVIGGYAFTNPDELSNLGKKEYQKIDITYNTSSPYAPCRFWTTEYGSHLFCTEGNLVFRGAFARIEKIVMSRRRKWHWVDSFSRFAWLLAIIATVSSIDGKIYNNLGIAFIGNATTVIMFIYLILYLATIRIRKTKIILGHEIDRDSFWRRNEDKIIVAIISGAISMAFGVFGTLIIQSILK